MSSSEQEDEETDMMRELSRLHLRIRLEGTDPFPWIYAVDDSWIHPARIKVSGQTAVFQSHNTTGIPYSEVSVPKNFLDEEAHGGDDEGEFVSGATTSTDLNGGGNPCEWLRSQLGNGGGAPTDSPTARELIAFLIREEGAFGLCFCSFEYFWANIAEINRPQNAVFFDLRHQLAAELPTEHKIAETWQKRLKRFFPNNSGQMSRLGWMLHYALKFSEIRSQSRCEIDFEHLLIISSAIAPSKGMRATTPATPPTEGSKEEEERDAIGEVLDVQGEIFEGLANDGSAAGESGTKSPKVTPAMFSWAPLPKRSGADQAILRFGLKVFHNSFSKTGSWGAVKKSIYHDLRALWRNEIQPVSLERAGHVNDNDARESIVNCLGWGRFLLDGHPNFFKRDFGGIYRKAAPSEVGLPVFISLLSRCAVPEIAAAANAYKSEKMNEGGIPEDIVVVPSRPGILFIYGLIEFVSLLKPDGKPRRVAPSVRIETLESELKVLIEFPECGKDSGIAELKKKYDGDPNPSGNTATAVLRLLGKDSGKLLLLKLPSPDGEISFGEMDHWPEQNTTTGKFSDHFSNGKGGSAPSPDEFSLLCWLPHNAPTTLIFTLKLGKQHPNR
jgi:hypothetical protein